MFEAETTTYTIIFLRKIFKGWKNHDQEHMVYYYSKLIMVKNENEN